MRAAKGYKRQGSTLSRAKRREGSAIRKCKIEKRSFRSFTTKIQTRPDPPVPIRNPATLYALSLTSVRVAYLRTTQLVGDKLVLHRVRLARAARGQRSDSRSDSRDVRHATGPLDALRCGGLAIHGPPPFACMSRNFEPSRILHRVVASLQRSCPYTYGAYAILLLGARRCARG